MSHTKELPEWDHAAGVLEKSAREMRAKIAELKRLPKAWEDGEIDE